MSASETPDSSASVTIENCADEPIHIPGSIQPHGLLLVLEEPSFTIIQVSKNSSSILGMEPNDLLGQPLSRVVGEDQQNSIIEDAEASDLSPKNPFLKNINPLNLTIRVGNKDLPFNGIVHRSNHGLVLELEPLPEDQALSFRHFYHLSRKSLLSLQSTENLSDLYEVAAQEVRQLTGFDRVMIYQFNEEWNGDVVAESQAEEVTDSYLGMHFPATDIPEQARALYLKNWLRFIPDAQYQPAGMVAHDPRYASSPLDMSYGVLRSVSPIHLEYLRNMNVRATLTISLVKDNQLWGLIACHHFTPRYVPYQVRVASEYIGQILSLQLSLKQKSEGKLIDMEQRRIHSLLMETITRHKDYMQGFVIASSETLTLTDSRGAAVFHEGDMQLLGQTPTADQVKDLLDWLKDQLDEVNYIFYTNTLSQSYAPAAQYSNVAAGVLAVQVAKPQQSYIFWFRPEAVQEVHWGGKPDKFVVEEEGKYRLHPRKSFALWKERVDQASLAWQDYHLEIARTLRNALKDIFVFKAEEYRQQKEALEQLNQKLKEEAIAREQMQKLLEMSNSELERFAYVASHDLQEPLRATANFTSLLKKRYEGQLDERAQRYIHFIVDGTARMQTLINDILSYSRLQTKGKTLVEVDTNKLTQEVKQTLQVTIKQHKAKIITGSLPTVKGDPKQFEQLFQNIIGNAIKYHGEQAPVIHIDGEEQEDKWQFSIRDNGIGIEPEYFDRIFIIFQRLHTNSEYEGTGVGLAICKRIVERHHGNIWLTSEVGQGTTFYFTISKYLNV